MVGEFLLLPKPCSTRKAGRFWPGFSPSGASTTPDRCNPAEGMLTVSALMTFPPARFSIALQLIETELIPALLGRFDIVLLRPDRGREAGAAKFRVWIVVEVDGGIDQHAVPFAGAELRRIAVALACRWIEP